MPSEPFTSDSPIPPGADGEGNTLYECCPACGEQIDVTDLEPLSHTACPACRTQFVVGEWIDHYQLLSVAGRGGMGVVFRALDTSLDRTVALKVLRKDRLTTAAVSELETEAAITASINHPHVVKVFTTGTDHGRFYLAMELVDKGTLDDLIRIQGQVAEVQVLEIAIQVAQGLRAALHLGMIHRDVKPGNILFADAHTAKVVDFGLAMLEQAAAEAAGAEIWGTPYYVAPEKLDQQPEDFRSDMYSLGATLFHALAGRPPFEAEDASMVALKHLKSQAVSLQAFAPRVSGSTAYVINRTLLKNPDERYQSYDELIEHLQYARNELLQHGGKAPEKKPFVLETEEDQKLWSYLTFGMIAVCLILVGGFFYLKNSAPADKPAPPPPRSSHEPAPVVASAPEPETKPEVADAQAVPTTSAAPTTDSSGALLFETENLEMTDSSGGEHRIITGAGFSNGKGTILDAKAVGDYVAYLVPNLTGGVYEIHVGIKARPDRGIWQLSGGRADTFKQTVKDIGTPQDEYAPTEAFVELYAGDWDPVSSNDKMLRFTVTGKNPKSSGYSIAFDYIKLVRKK